MDLLGYTKAIEKHGVKTLMIIALIWMNNRLTDVEEKLYRCYDQVRTDAIRRADSDVKIDGQCFFAVIPDRKRRKNERIS